MMGGFSLERYAEDIEAEAKGARQIFESFMQRHNVSRSTNTPESLSFGWLKNAPVSSITRAIEQLTMAASSIAMAVEEQSTTTRDIAGSIQTAAGHTGRASAEILSIEQAASRSVTAFGEIADLTLRVSSRAKDLESSVAAFFNRVRAA